MIFSIRSRSGYYLKELSQNPVTSSIKGSLSEEEIKRCYVGNSDYLTTQLILWKVLSRRQQNGFNHLWQTAKKSFNNNE